MGYNFLKGGNWKDGWSGIGHSNKEDFNGIIYRNKETGEEIVFTAKAKKLGAIKVPPGFKKVGNEKE